MGIIKDCKSFKYRIIKSEEVINNEIFILFSGMDSYQKRDLQSKAKKARFKTVYSIKHPLKKNVIQKLSLRNIENDKFKTSKINTEYFCFLFRNLL